MLKDSRFFNQWASDERLIKKLLTRVRINIAKEAMDTELAGTIQVFSSDFSSS